jgi:hypothetical protein
MFRSTNAINELYACTEHPVLRMGENITANNRKLSELCKYNVGHASRTCKSTFLGAGRQKLSLELEDSNSGQRGVT